MMCSPRPLTEEPQGDSVMGLNPNNQMMSTEKYRLYSQGFFGRFAPIRARLDYSFHSVYSQERQLLQDKIILSFLSKGRPSVEEPWAIFTGGVMGCGKSFVMEQLQRRGLLCVEDFVYVDPDALRECLPEYAMYLQQDAETAGSVTQKEAGFMAEILTLAALECAMNIIVDGSLKDSMFYECHFRQLKRECPKLCLAIFLISAPLEDIYERVVVSRKCQGKSFPYLYARFDQFLFF